MASFATSRPCSGWGSDRKQFANSCRGTRSDPESVAQTQSRKLKSLEVHNAGVGMSSDIDDDGDYSSIDSRDPKMEIKNGVGLGGNGVAKSDLLMRYFLCSIKIANTDRLNILTH